MALPPKPTYPKAIDSDRTLFLVYNTSEAKLAIDNNPWSQEIEIIPVKADKPEIWADNGFANIDGELFYYDSVEKNSDGKVYKFKKCARNLGGSKTKFNRQGTWVRGFVIAEHHNQLVDSILNVEDFVGFNFDPRIETLDWRIRNLREVPVIFDDWNCPEINFTFNIVENNPQTGILANYLIEISSTGELGTSNFRLDFGDGTFTTSVLSGTHRYAVNAFVDPVLTITNDNCQIIASPINRANPLTLPDFTEVPFEVAVPPTPIIPPITAPSITCPEPEVQIPPIITPCATLETGFPSIIGGGINLISNITITGPTNNIPSIISIVGGFTLPDIILFDNVPVVPPTISIIGSLPSTIIIEIPSSSILLNFDTLNLPALQVDWGIPPDMRVQLAMPTRPIPRVQALRNEFGQEFGDIFQEDSLNVEYETVGIPSEIKVVPPEEPIEIKLKAPEIKDIFLKNYDIPSEIKLVKDKSLEEGIKLISPKSIKLEMLDTIKVETISPIPDRIILDASSLPTSIKVEGIPDTIRVEGIPDSLKLDFPDKMPEIELVYKGSPIEMKLSIDQMLTSTEDGTGNCVMIVPCKR